MGKLKVIKSGLMLTIQDEGRLGYRQFGIPQSGAMDKDAMHLANELVGNRADLPVVEFAVQGIKLEAVETTTIAITGARTDIRINDNRATLNTSYKVVSGDTLSISAPLEGVYSYIGIGGKIQAKKDFGSCSTYLMAEFGGLNGKSLKAGDLIVSKEDSPFKRRAKEVITDCSDIEVVRMLPGPEWSMLKEAPDRKVFQIDASSNRMGIRLAGETISIEGSEIPSSAVIPGTVQLPAGGSPIVLLNDCQTTGGYPRIGKVIDADLGRLAQMPAGTRLKFEMITFEEAQNLMNP
ncbi:MAG: biotin-dependent carboxyltransferase family protein [Cyclobacteriaceae bacterium]